MKFNKELEGGTVKRCILLQTLKSEDEQVSRHSAVFVESYASPTHNPIIRRLNHAI